MRPLDDRELTVTVGLGGMAGDSHGQTYLELPLTLGPGHPSAHGGLRLELTLDGERVRTCRPVVGLLHRGVEKLFEARDYRQVLVLANRHDWLSAFSSELGVVLAVERLLGIEVPTRAVWARTLLAELNRALSHLVFLGAGLRALSTDDLSSLSVARERVQTSMEEVTGGRLHFMFNRVGGLRDDLPRGWLTGVLDTTAAVRQVLPAVHDVLADERVQGATRGVGALARPLVDQYGVSGPIARASGADFDLRRDEPYLAYGDLAAAGVLRVPLGREGDSHARFTVLAEQLAVSLDLVDACVEQLARLPVGPVSVPLPKNVRPPEGATYAWTENPLGLNGYYLVSRGEKTPWRMKLRSASFNNVAVLPEVLVGCRVSDLTTALASFFFVVGDVDK
jgi:NADH-quinone oxidoreductase subunit D